MKPFLRSLFGRSGTVRKQSRAARSAQLALERLEDRTLLTVYFAPNFPGIKVDAIDWQNNNLVKTNGTYQAALHVPQVYILFTNSSTWDWNNHTADMDTLLDAARHMVTGYLDGMHQYGYLGGASVAGAWIDAQIPALTTPRSGTYPFGDNWEQELQAYLFGPNENDGAISRAPFSPLPEASSEFDVPLFVIVPPPGAKVFPPLIFGLNTFAPDKLGAIAVVETLFNVLSDPSSGVNKDRFTSAFSHELVEAISHELVVDFPPLEVLAGLGATARDQIADGEPDGSRYTARLATGELVQAYWSENDQAFIVPDGCQEATFKKPVWSRSQWLSNKEVRTNIQVLGIEGVTPTPSLLGLPANDIIDFNSRSYRARTDTDGNPNIRIQVVGGSAAVPLTALDGTTETARGNPSLAVFNNQLWVAWTGTDTVNFAGSLNVAVVALDASGTPTGATIGKETLGYRSEHAPALGSFDNALFLAHAGTTDQQLFLDFITVFDPTWGLHTTDTHQRTESPPGFAEDCATHRLAVIWTGTDDAANIGLIDLTSKSVTPLVALPPVVGGFLAVDGNQFVGMNDTITLDQSLAGGVRLTLNGIVRDYAPGSLSSIVIDTGPGTNTVSVLATPRGVPLTINALGQTTLTVGNRGSMTAIKSDLTIWGAYHSVDLTLDDSNYRQDQAIQLRSQGGVETVTGMSVGSTIRFGHSDLSKLTLQTSRYGRLNTVKVYDTPDTRDFTDLHLNGLNDGTGKTNSVFVYGTTGALNVKGDNPGKVFVTVFPAGFDNERPSSEATIRGAVDVSNTAGSTSLTIDDGNDALNHPNVRLERARLTGLSPAAITWRPGLMSPGVTSLTVFGGGGTNTYTVVDTAVLPGGPIRLSMGNGTNTVNVEHTVGSLSVDLHRGADTVNVSPTTRDLQAIQGALTVTGGDGYGRLWFNDQASTANNTYWLTGSSLLRAAVAPITYAALKEIRLGGGAGQETYRVQNTALGAATYLTTNSVPSGPTVPSGPLIPGSQVIVEGTGATGGLVVSGASGLTQVTVGGGLLQGIRGNILVDSAGGQVNLDVNDSQDGSSPTASLAHRRIGFRVLPDQETIAGLAQAAISYYGDRVTPTIDLGSGALSILDTGGRLTTVNAAGASVKVVGSTGGVQINATGGRLITVGNGSVQQIRGAVNVNSADRSALLIVAGANDSGRAGTLTAGASNVLTGLAPAMIAYALGEVRPTINLGPRSSLTVTGPRGLDQLGPVRVVGIGGNDSLKIDDRQGSSLPADLPADATSVRGSLAYAVTGQNVTRSTSYSYATAGGGSGGASLTAIDYQGIANLEVDGSNQGAGFSVAGNVPPGTMVNGGTGKDTFTVANGTSRFTADGGAGINTLDYSAFAGNVTVNLALGTATGIAGGIRNIQNVIGGPGNDVLVGNGSNVLTGGGGRNLLIAGPGASTLIGNVGEDILVGGSTNWDTTPAALAAVMAEWTRLNLDYSRRVGHLLNGGGLNGLTRLNGSTFASNGGANRLTGTAALDLFFGSLARDSYDWKAIEGEVFVENGKVLIRVGALDVPYLLLDDTQPLGVSTSQSFDLTPGVHSLSYSGSSIAFGVSSSGLVSYAPALEGALTGAGFSTLGVNGWAITLDARALGRPTVALDGASYDATALVTRNLLPGQHAVSTAAYPGAVQSFTVAAGGDIDFDSALDSILSGRSTRTLVFLQPAPRDRVWQDLNGNGVQDRGEPGIAGAAVELFHANSDGFATSLGVQITGADGHYQFASPSESSGSFYLVFRPPVGFAFTTPGQGSDPTLDSDADQGTGRTASYTLSNGAPLLAAGLVGAMPAFGFALRAGDSGFDGGADVATDATGNVYVTGYFYGTVDFDPGPGAVNLQSAGGSDLFVAKYTPAGALVWARQLGGTNDDGSDAIAVDGAGNVYTTGYFSGTADFGAFTLTSAGSYDVFVSKLDSAGNFVWARQLGGTDYDVGSGIAVDGAGNVSITGYFSGTADFDPGAGTFDLTSAGSYDAFVSKLDSAGNFVWVRQLAGANNDYGSGIAVDGAGNVYTTGYFSGTADFDPAATTFDLTGAGGRDTFVSKLDSAGNFVWARQLGGSGYDVGSGIAVDGAGNVSITGYFSGTADFDPGAGTFDLTSAGSYDAFVSKLDSAGNFVWVRQLAGANNDYGSGIAVDGAGNVYTTGYFSGTADFDPAASRFDLTSAGSYDAFVSKLDRAGNFVWARQFGDTNGASNDGTAGTGIALDGAGDVYITGFAGAFDAASGGRGDVFVNKLDTGGNLLWARQLGGTNDGVSVGNSIALDSAGNVYTTGFFSGTADFDPGAGTFDLTSVGSYDLFVSKLSGP